MRPEDMIRQLPGPAVEAWIAQTPAGSYRDRHAFLTSRGLSSNHAAAVLWWEKNGEAIMAGGGALIDRTKTRVDLGLRLPGDPFGPRLVEAGSFGSGTITHKVALTSVDDVDAEVEGWLRAAYDARG
jgi:Domain of unknown function (DUF5655)